MAELNTRDQNATQSKEERTKRLIKAAQEEAKTRPVIDGEGSDPKRQEKLDEELGK